VLQLQGEPDEVLPLNCSSGLDGVTAQDFGMAVLKYPRGWSFVKTTAVELGGFMRRQLVVVGTKGTVELKPLEEGTEGVLTTDEVCYTSEDWHLSGKQAKYGPFDRYDTMMAAFAGMVLDGTENPYTPDYEWDLYRTVLRCCGK